MTSNADSACMRSPCSRLNSALSSSTCSRRLAAVFGVYHARFREPKRRVRLPVTRVRLRARLTLEGASSGVSSGGCRVATISTCRRISRCGGQSSRFVCGKSAAPAVTLEWEVCPAAVKMRYKSYNATRNKIILHLLPQRKLAKSMSIRLGLVPRLAPPSVRPLLRPTPTRPSIRNIRRSCALPPSRRPHTHRTRASPSQRKSPRPSVRPRHSPCASSLLPPLWYPSGAHPRRTLRVTSFHRMCARTRS